MTNYKSFGVNSNFLSQFPGYEIDRIDIPKIGEDYIFFSCNDGDWSRSGFFWKIDEVTDPYACEYKEVNIDMDFFSISWPSPMISEEEKFQGAEIDPDFTVNYVNKHFEKEKGWKDFQGFNLDE